MVTDAQLTKTNKRTFVNFHETVKEPISGVWVIENSKPETASLGRMKETAGRIQTLIRHATQSQKRLRAIGRKWSFSEIPLPDEGWVLQTDRLNYRFRVTSTVNLDPNYLGDANELYLVQCGTEISEINRKIETKTRRRALRTSGASNGQTIAGAMGTGTHGSAIDVGAIQSQVCGIQLLTGNENLWIEDPSDPVMNETFAKKLGATLIRDVQLFQAALVSLGSLGVIHSVMLRTTGRYWLESFRRPMRFSEVRRAINTLDFTGVPLPKPNERPYFFQVVIDPDRGKDAAYVTTRYKIPCPLSEVPDYEKTSGHGIHNDLPGIVGKFIDHLSAIGPQIVSVLLKSQQKAKEFTGTPGETYDRTSGKKGVLGCAIAVPIAQTERAVELIRDVIHQKFGPLIIALRFVQKSPGLLSFTQYDPCCVIDIDGIDSKAARSVITRVLKKFDQEGMPYSQHWGKIHGMTKTRIRNSYGQKIDRWQDVRDRLLPTEDEKIVFANKLTDKIGLT